MAVNGKNNILFNNEGIFEFNSFHYSKKNVINEEINLCNQKNSNTTNKEI